MADHDDEPSPGFGGESWMPTGPRRSTYTPPLLPPPADPPADEPSSTEPPPTELSTAHELKAPEPAPVQPAAVQPPVVQPAAVQPPIVDFFSLPAPTGPPVVPADVSGPPPPTAGLPPAPQRRSLDDLDLIRTIDEGSRVPGATLDTMDKLEAELRLREVEAREFTEWQTAMVSIGTPAALRTIDDVKTTFTGVINIIQPTEPEQAVIPPAAVQPPARPIFDLVEPAQTGALDFRDASAPSEASQAFAFAPPPTVETTEADPIELAAPQFEEEAQDDVDATDLAFDDLLTAIPATAPGSADSPTAGPGELVDQHPAEPSADEQAPDEQAPDEQSLGIDEPTSIRAGVVESSGVEPTPLDRRVGRAARMFWLWFATNSTVLSVAFGAALFSLGMSLRQAVVAGFIGVALSFLPLGLGTLAGKWSGQPTLVASRATFGVNGNIVPALLAVITRVFWGAVLLWLVAVSTARILIGAQLSVLSELQLTVVTLAVGFLIALAVAVFGYGLFARIQTVLSILAAILVIGLIAVTWPSVNIQKALTVGDGPWILVVTGTVLVFSFIGLVWMSSSGDLARYQRPSSSGAAAMIWAPLGATLPAFILIAYGALLAASGHGFATGLTTHPLDTIALMMPVWYPVPLIAASVLSLLSGVVLSIYSGGFALQAAGLRLHRAWSSVIIGVLLFVIAVVLSFTVGGSVVPVFRDLATSLAVPVAAWAGIFSADMIIRRRRFDTPSLLRAGGVYPTVNWANLALLVVITAVGYGLTTATVSWLGWQGYIFSALGVPRNSDLAGTDIGVLVALVLALAVTFATGVPTVRKQERELTVSF